MQTSKHQIKRKFKTWKLTKHFYQLLSILLISVIVGIIGASHYSKVKYNDDVQYYQNYMITEWNKHRTLKVTNMLPQEYQDMLEKKMPKNLNDTDKEKLDIMVNGVVSDYQEIWFINHPNK